MEEIISNEHIKVEKEKKEHYIDVYYVMYY